MTIQSIFLGFLLATLYGAAFHLWKGGSLWRLVLYLIFAWAGFWIGHFVGNALGWNFFRVGSLNVGLGTMASVLVIGIGYWLSLVQIDTNPTKK